MKTGRPNGEPVKQRIDDGLNAPETDAPDEERKASKILSFVFFGVAVVSLLIVVYVRTAKDLSVPAILAPILYLGLGWGGGFGMLFRSFWKKDENVSSINYFFKIGFSVLILISVFLSVLFALLTTFR